MRQEDSPGSQGDNLVVLDGLRLLGLHWNDIELRFEERML